MIYYGKLQKNHSLVITWIFLLKSKCSLKPSLQQFNNTCIFVITVCRRRLDLAFLIDGSGSIEAYGRGNFQRCLNFVKQVVASFGISPSQTRVGIVLFSSRAWLIANFRSYRSKQSVLHAVSRIRYPRGGTRIGRALRFAKYQLFRKRTSQRKVSAGLFPIFCSLEFWSSFSVGQY